MLGKKAKKAVAKPFATRQYNAKIKIYRDGADEYRWRLVARNGRIIADSAEGYADKYHCEQAVDRFIEAATMAEIVEVAQDLSL